MRTLSVITLSSSLIITHVSDVKSGRNRGASELLCILENESSTCTHDLSNEFFFHLNDQPEQAFSIRSRVLLKSIEFLI